MHILKPLDIVVALKIGLNERRARAKDPLSWVEEAEATNSVGDLASSLYKGKGDISRSISRLVELGLIGERQPKAHDIVSANRKYYSLQRNAMSGLLVSGIRHMFAPAKMGYGRGMPTGWSCPLIKSPMNPPQVPLVWAAPGGEIQGELLEPLYPKCPESCLRDPALYELLSLVDIIRTGKPRELKYATEILHDKVMGLHA